MGGCRCSYRSCKSATKVSGDLHFFHYPVKHRDRCNQWIKNARRPEFFDLPDDQLRNKVICDLHFEPRYFTNELRKRLVHNAVPTVNTGCEEDVLNENNIEFKDVQILPANDDGTIFTVNTDSMQQKSDNTPISTYSFRNGALVPVYSIEEQNDTEQVLYTIEEDDLKPVSYRDSNTNDYLFVDSNRSEEMQESYEIVFNGNSDNSQTSIERKSQVVSQYPRRNYVNNQQENAAQERMEVVYLHEGHGQPPIVIKTESDAVTIEPVKPKAPKPRHEARNVVFENHKPVPVSAPFKRKFMNQMKVHSREIASIKRTLSASLRQSSKFNINKLRGRIAPSLLGALSLNLHNRKSNFNKEEIDFLTTVYKISPEMYNILIEKLHWNLPEASVVQQLLKK